MVQHFGPADEESHDERGCSAQIYEDGLVVPYWSDDSYSAELLVSTREVNGIRVETPNGLSIGDDAWGLIEATDPELKRDMGAGHPDGSYPYWAVVYDPVAIWGEGTAQPNRYGARALIHEGTLSSIMVPGSLGSMHTSC